MEAAVVRPHWAAHMNERRIVVTKLNRDVFPLSFSLSLPCPPVEVSTMKHTSKHEYFVLTPRGQPQYLLLAAYLSLC